MGGVAAKRIKGYVEIKNFPQREVFIGRSTNLFALGRGFHAAGAGFYALAVYAGPLQVRF
jgi:hypothetical protein